MAPPGGKTVAICGAFLVVSLASICATQAQEPPRDATQAVVEPKSAGVKEGNSKSPTCRDARHQRTQRSCTLSHALRPVPGHCIRVNTPQRLEENLLVRRARTMRTMDYVSHGETFAASFGRQTERSAPVPQKWKEGAPATVVMGKRVLALPILYTGRSYE